jgi:hypothetical protein
VPEFGGSRATIANVARATASLPLSINNIVSETTDPLNVGFRDVTIIIYTVVNGWNVAGAGISVNNVGDAFVNGERRNKHRRRRSNRRGHARQRRFYIFIDITVIMNARLALRTKRYKPIPFESALKLATIFNDVYSAEITLIVATIVNIHVYRNCIHGGATASSLSFTFIDNTVGLMQWARCPYIERRATDIDTSAKTVTAA